jgi:hypothetical protein
MPLWFDLLLLALGSWAAWELVTNPDIHDWIEFHCRWACQ